MAYLMVGYTSEYQGPKHGPWARENVRYPMLLLILSCLFDYASCHGDGHVGIGKRPLGHINHCESTSQLGLSHMMWLPYRELKDQ